MAVVTETFLTRWASGRHVGSAKPRCRMWVRRGRFFRGYDPWDYEGHGEYAIIPRQPAGLPWQATWTPQGDWLEVPNLFNVRLDQSFDQNGVTVATVLIDNIDYPRTAGMYGLFYHAIRRGAFAPWRGYEPPTMPDWGIEQTTWYERLIRSAQIRIEQGYGDETTTSFTGLIDDVDMDSFPDRVTLTARDFGQQLTDQRLFGWVKDKDLRDPIIFADRQGADEVEGLGTGADASSAESGYPASNVADDDPDTYWRAQPHTSAAVTEWVEVRLPAGRYETARLATMFTGMDAYIGVYGRGAGATDDQVTVDGEVYEDGWLHVGNGDVPGTYGGWPWIAKHTTVAGEKSYQLGHILELGDDSVLRVGFRNLHEIGGEFRVFVSRLAGVRRVLSEQAVDAKWILVDDMADVVRVVLRWAGFKEWKIEDTGLRMKGHTVWGRSTFLIDIIRNICDQTGYVFFIGDPTGPESIGRPVFRYTRAVAEQGDVDEPTPLLRDTALLTGAQVKITDEPLAYIIRVRGKTAKITEGGTILGGDTIRRIMATYRPPWTQHNRLAGVITHVTHTDYQLKTEEECLVKCMLIALAEALASVTATIEIPGAPQLQLDTHVAVQDAGSGVNSRLWVTNRSSEWQGGASGYWRTTLGGALVDTPDLVELRDEIRTLMPDTRDPTLPANRMPPNMEQGWGIL